MQTDDLLVQRVVAGDEEAFAELVERYKNPLVNYLTHLVRSRDRAEELAQDTFVRLYRNIANYREQEKLGPYLFRIATNLVVTEVRREKRWTLLLPRLNASSSNVAAPPDRTLMESEIQRQVSAALERLAIKYRAPLLLFEIEEWSYEEIGRALDLRAGTVKSRISRARELLRRELAPYWIGGSEHERSGTARSDSSPAAHERIAVLRP